MRFRLVLFYRPLEDGKSMTIGRRFPSREDASIYGNELQGMHGGTTIHHYEIHEDGLYNPNWRPDPREAK